MGWMGEMGVWLAGLGRGGRGGGDSRLVRAAFRARLCPSMCLRMRHLCSRTRDGLYYSESIHGRHKNNKTNHHNQHRAPSNQFFAPATIPPVTSLLAYPCRYKSRASALLPSSLPAHPTQPRTLPFRPRRRHSSGNRQPTTSSSSSSSFGTPPFPQTDDSFSLSDLSPRLLFSLLLLLLLVPTDAP